jgi:hypothetical protein
MEMDKIDASVGGGSQRWRRLLGLDGADWPGPNHKLVV